MGEAESARVDSRTLKALLAWYRAARKASWRSFDDVRADFPTVDRVGRLLIFDIAGNRFRLIVAFNFHRQNIHIKALLTHAQYDRKEWMKWS
jgi:mRNA interferase HigB